MRHPRRWLLLAAVLIAASAVVPAAVLSPSVPAYASRSSVPLESDDLILNESPSGHILFGSPLPMVEVVSTSNASPAATLGLTHLLELAPNASAPSRPTVVAEAAPEALERFNGTVYNGTPKYFNLIATLPVYPANAVLWASGTDVAPAGDAASYAILDVNYSVATGSDGSPGVRISWTVSGWPWANPSGDELALEYVVQVYSGSGFETCTGAPSTEAPDATCATQALALGQPVWSSAFTALKGNGPGGSVAWISWGSQEGGSNPNVAPVSAGAYFEQPGTSALAIAAPADGAVSVAGSTLFLLSPGAVQSLAPLVGNLPVYGGAAAVFGAAAIVGVLLSRRRDRAIARELAS